MSFLAFLDMVALRFMGLFRRRAVPESDNRRDRALAIACASVSFRGVAMDVESLLGLADEFLDYIQGDDSSPIPRPDKTGAKGRLPKP
jgi:hypothetical protein